MTRTTTRMATMPTDDPWKGIDPPVEADRITARRIPDAGTHAWGLYWAIDSQHHCLLILQHRSEHRHSRRVPTLRGLRVEVVPTEDQSGERLIIRLTDGEQREVFHRFCVDIVDATRPACSEADAVERFLVRTWRWHRLLRGGSDGRLSQEEQRGLIGELCVLEHQLLPVIGPVDAVRAWDRSDRYAKRLSGGQDRHRSQDPVSPLAQRADILRRAARHCREHTSVPSCHRSIRSSG